MKQDPLHARLAAYRDATSDAAASPELLLRLTTTMPRRARTRRFLRDARVGLMAAVVVSTGSGVWAHLEQQRLERQLYVHVSAWVEAP